MISPRTASRKTQPMAATAAMVTTATAIRAELAVGGVAGAGGVAARRPLPARWSQHWGNRPVRLAQERRPPIPAASGDPGVSDGFEDRGRGGRGSMRGDDLVTYGIEPVAGPKGACGLIRV